MALWTPSVITTALWLQADDLTAGALAQWDDDSGDNQHATQATGSKQPTVVEGVLNGLPIVRFDGTDDELVGPDLGLNSSSFSVFVVASAAAESSVSEYHAFFRMGGGSSGWHMSRYPLDTRQRIQFFNNGTSAETANSSYPNAGVGTKILGVVKTLSTRFVHHWDGVEQINVTTAGMTAALTTGGTYGIGRETGYLAADIAEIVVVPSAVDTDTRRFIEGYLAHKWGLEGSLDAGHPYKAAAPVILTVSGIITDDAGNPTARTVRLYTRSSGALLAETTSDAGDGSYSFTVSTTDEVQRIVLDDAAGTLYNDLIDRVIPG